MTDVADQHEVAALLVAFFHGFDDRRADDAFLRSVFAGDATVGFPTGSATGVEEIRAVTERSLALWGRTLHGVSSPSVTVARDRAGFRATLHATHVHRDDDPGRPLQIGASLGGEAVRGVDRWRLSSLTIDLVWTDGDGPS